jgi:hypothetical protein
VARVFFVGGRPLRTFANAIENASDSGVIEYLGAYFHVGMGVIPLGGVVSFGAVSGVVIGGNSHTVDLSDRT